MAKAERHILSHDQIEAALMRSAGYHVRVVAQEDLGWEENPPTLLEFHAPRSALVPGKHAVLAVSCASEPQARKPLSVDACHRDVYRLSGLDRVAGACHDRACIV